MCNFYTGYTRNAADDARVGPLLIDSIFSRLSLFRCRTRSPETPSFYVNGASYSDGIFRVQMQSGDTIEIVATGFSLDAV